MSHLAKRQGGVSCQAFESSLTVFLPSGQADLLFCSSRKLVQEIHRTPQYPKKGRKENQITWALNLDV